MRSQVQVLPPRPFSLVILPNLPLLSDMDALETLRRIKRAVLAGNFEFSAKALAEMQSDHLTDRDIVECIVNAVAITKIVRSRSPERRHRGEKLYIIISTNLDGLPIYTKGKFARVDGVDQFYFLISSKRSTEL
jgi:hypothetical protein